MRRIIVTEFISVDGIMEGPGPDDPFKFAGWTMAYGNAETMKIKLDEVMASDALLLGKTTYEGFAAAWPGRTDEMGFGDKMNSMKKYVVSDTLKTADWNNAEIIAGKDLVEKVTELKNEDGGDILVNGSSVLVKSLIDNNLVDLFRLLTFPIILGTGKRLFNENDKVELKLVNAKSFDTGVVLLEYKTKSKV
jgi:dihydrofolate reductase